MLTFSAIVPHPVISIPEIGKENINRIPQTIRASKIIRQELYASKPDFLIIITPHAVHVDDAFSINQAKELSINLKEFGDLSKRPVITNNIGLGYKIRESVEDSMPLILSENENLDYGSAIPLINSLNGLKDIKVVIIGTAPKLSLGTHFELGVKIMKQLDNNPERIAVLASADLSHDQEREITTTKKPNIEFDRSLISLIEKQKINEFLAISEADVLRAAACGVRPIAVLLGLLKNKKYSSKVLSYEHSIGIGYPTILIQTN